MMQSTTTLKVLGRGDPRDSVRQSAARMPATAEEAPKMYSGTAALRDPCQGRLSRGWRDEEGGSDLVREVDCNPGS